jgi:hypothetical protein
MAQPQDGVRDPQAEVNMPTYHGASKGEYSVVFLLDGVLKVCYLVVLIEHTGSLNPAYSCETAAPMVSSIEEPLYL